MNTLEPQIGPAVAELEGIEVHGMNRGSFILKSALAAGAVYGTSMIAPFVQQAFAAAGTTDVDILNFALTLEFLETAFYKKAATLKLDSTVMPLVKSFGAQEAEHVTAISGTITKLGGTPTAMPTFAFPITDQASFLKIAIALEDTGVGAYNGAAPSIMDKDVLAAAGSIVQIEARHAGVLRYIAGMPPAPAAFDTALDKPAVLKAAGPFIKS